MSLFHKILFALIILISSDSVHAGLVISEIMVRPSSRDGLPSGGSNEWFEIFNSGMHGVDLSTIRYDTDGDASNGSLLGGGVLESGKYAIIGDRTLTQWQATYGTLPTGVIYHNVTGWKILYNDQYLYPSESLDLYSTVTNSEIFSIRYPNPTTGRSFQYMGQYSVGISPFALGSSSWVVSSTRPSGSTDYHSAGTSNLQAAPEPGAILLASLACIGLAIVVWRQRAGLIAEPSPDACV